MDAKTAILSFVDIAKTDVAKAVSLLREGLSNQQPGTGTGSALSALSGHFDLHVIPLLAQLLDKYLSSPKCVGEKSVGEEPPTGNPAGSDERTNIVISDDVAFDCFWALVNIGAGDSSVTQLLLKHGVAELAVRAVRECRSQEVVENAIWVLGNIAGDGQASRETLYNMGASEVLTVRTACELGRLGYFPFGMRFQRATEVAAALAAGSAAGDHSGGGSSSSSSSESSSDAGGVVSGLNNAVFPSRGPRRKSSLTGDTSSEVIATAATAVSHGPNVVGGLASRKNGNHSGSGGGGRLKYTTPLLKIAMWTLSNLCENDSEGRRCIPNLRNVLAVLSVCLDCPDAEVQSHACWALSHIADGPTEHMFDILCSLCASVPPVPISSDSNLSASLSDTVFDENVLGSWICLPSVPGKDAAASEAAAALPLATSFSLQDRYGASEVYSRNRELVQRASSLWNESNAAPSIYSFIILPSAACRVVRLLRHDSTRVTKPALRCVGNIVCAEDNDHDFTQVLVDLGVVSQLNRLMVSSARDILKEACWTMSNVAAGSSVQIQAVLDSGCIPRATHLCTDPSTDPSVRNEACWIILNSISCGTEQQIDSLVRKGAVRVLCQLLPEPTMSVMALEGLEKILNVIETLSKRKTEEHPRMQNHQSSDARKGGGSGKTESKSSAASLAAASAALNANSTLVGTLATAITNAFANLGNLSLEDQAAMGYVGQEHRGGSKSRGGSASSALTTATLFEAKCLLETFRVELSTRGAANKDSNDSAQKDDHSALGQASQAAFGQATQKIKSALTSQNLSSALLNAKQGSPSGDYAMRRVTKLWGDHFVSCQLCHRSWPKNAATTRFCDECRCNVCSECNCEKFHLSYQLQLLEEPSSTTISSTSKAGNNAGSNNSGGSAASSKNSEKAQGAKKRTTTITQNQPQSAAANLKNPVAAPLESQTVRNADNESSSSSSVIQDTDDWDESLLISSSQKSSAPKTVRRAVQAQNRSSSTVTSGNGSGTTSTLQDPVIAAWLSQASSFSTVQQQQQQQQHIVRGSDISELGGFSNESGWEPIKTKAQAGRARRRGDTELVPSTSSTSSIVPPIQQAPFQSPQKQFVASVIQSPLGKAATSASTVSSPTSSIVQPSVVSSQNYTGSKTTTTPPQQTTLQFKTLQQQLSKPTAPLSIDIASSMNQHSITSKVKPPLVPVVTSPSQRASTSPTLSSYIPVGSPSTQPVTSANGGERSWKAIVKHGSGSLPTDAIIRGDTASFPSLPSKLSGDETALDAYSNPQLPPSLYAENESSSSQASYFQHQNARSQSFGQADDLSQQQGGNLSSIAWRGKIPASVKPAEVPQYPGVSSSSLSSLSQQQQMLQTLSNTHFSAGNSGLQHPSLQPFPTGAGVVENETLQMQLMIQQMLATAASASFSAQEAGGLASTQESIFSAIFANPAVLPSQFIDADSNGGSKFSSAQSSRGGSIDEPPMRTHGVNNNGWPVIPSATRHDGGRGHSDSFLHPLHVDSFLHASNGISDGIRSASESGDLVSGVGSSVWGEIRSGDVGVSPSNGSTIELSGGGTGLSIPLLPRLWGSTSPTSFVDDRAPIFASSNAMQQQMQINQPQLVHMSFASASDEENVLKSLALDL